jgi:hypothetical protein
MSKNLFFSSFLVAFVIFFPNVSAAYFTTNQQAFAANKTLGLYTIEFKFGHGSRDVYIPINALSGYQKSSNALTYQIINNEKEQALGTTSGIVLSSTPVKDGMYVIPKGKTATFTLLTFFTPSDVEEGATFRTQVTNLPFLFDGTQELALNPSELTPYTTELVPLSAE